MLGIPASYGGGCFANPAEFGCPGFSGPAFRWSTAAVAAVPAAIHDKRRVRDFGIAGVSFDAARAVASYRSRFVGRPDAFFPNQLGGTSMPRNALFLRSGLQLLNWDALRFYSSFYFELNEVQQDFLLRAIQVAGDEHWPQVAAAEWLAEIDALMAEAASAASVSSGFASEQEKVETKGDGSSLRWFGLDGAVSG